MLMYHCNLRKYVLFSYVSFIDVTVNLNNSVFSNILEISSKCLKITVKVCKGMHLKVGTCYVGLVHVLLFVIENRFFFSKNEKNNGGIITHMYYRLKLQNLSWLLAWFVLQIITFKHFSIQKFYAARKKQCLYVL